MTTTVATPRKWNWLILDLLGTAALMLGFLTLFVPDVASGFGIPAVMAWPLIAVGGVTTFIAVRMFIRQNRAQRAG